MRERDVKLVAGFCLLGETESFHAQQRRVTRDTDHQREMRLHIQRLRGGPFRIYVSQGSTVS